MKKSGIFTFDLQTGKSQEKIKKSGKKPKSSNIFQIVSFTVLYRE